MTYQDLSRKILMELQEDGRQSQRELAEKLDVSAATIGNRISRLMEMGVLRGVTVDLDYEKLGYSVVTATRFKVPGDAIQTALEEMDRYSGLTDIYEITGEYDILAIGHFMDRDRMNAVIKDLQSHEAILETNTSFVLNTVKENAPLELKDLDV